MKTVSFSAFQQGGPVATPATGQPFTPENRTITALFAEQVKQQPDHPAVVFGNKVLTYANLDRRSNQLANYLYQRCRLSPDDKIGVMMDRSENLVITLLAVLKAGAAYVPMLPLYPARRLEYIARNSGVQAIITEAAFKDLLPADEELQKIPMLVLDEIDSSSWPTSSLYQEAGPQHLLYVMYTSGSTGTPKGIAIEQGPVVNVLSYFQQQLQIGKKDRMLAVATYAFDVSVPELFLPLIYGATVVMASRQEQLDPALLVRLIADQGITAGIGVPTVWQLITEQETWNNFRGNLKVLCGGEYLGKELGLKMLNKGIQLWNGYGPTETTICTTLKAVRGEEDFHSIGSPLPNVEILILDEQLREQPAGKPGEICIAGPALGRGYLHLPELTAAYFVAHPYRPGERLYRTGDLGRVLPNGEIAWLGRKDNLLKFRGYRIEPGEIEAALLRQPAIKQAVITVQENNRNDKKLIAYLVHKKGRLADADAAQIVEALRNALKQELPYYMQPHGYLFLESMPVNGNGKIDRKKLPNNKEYTQ